MAKIWGNYKIMMDRILGLMVVVLVVYSLSFGPKNGFLSREKIEIITEDIFGICR